MMAPSIMTIFVPKATKQPQAFVWEGKQVFFVSSDNSPTVGCWGPKAFATKSA